MSNKDVAKYGLLMILWTFPDKETPNIDFTNLAVVQSNALVVKMLW